MFLTQIQSLSDERPVLCLSLLFATWKLLLLLLALGAPGLGYDTSTALLSPLSGPGGAPAWTDLGLNPGLESNLLKLVRWDAIYFVPIAQRDYLFEQEWAFQSGFPKLVSSLAQVFGDSGNTVFITTAVGVTVSHVSHWLSVLVLFALTKASLADALKYRDNISFIAASIHIISPAGIFLSAPYSESLFSLVNMLGLLLYISATSKARRGAQYKSNVMFILAGAVLGYSTTIRSNGILSGLPFLYDAAVTSISILQGRNLPQLLPRLLALCVGGLSIAGGFLSPQYRAWSIFCSGLATEEARPWCAYLVPSIYSWVQIHYWNVGLFRYWTLSNLPLFLLALPNICILFYSAISILRGKGASYTRQPGERIRDSAHSFSDQCLIRLALPQLALVSLAVTTYHVQIINRLASGYPLWHIWLARKVLMFSTHSNAENRVPTIRVICQGLVMYAIIQAGLFASFLPPA